MTHLSAHEIALYTGPTGGVPSPTRVASIGHAALRIAGKRARLDGRRIGVLHPEPGAADALAQTLRQRGAQVAVLSLDPRHLARIEALDPEVIVVEPRHFTGAGWEALAGVFAHPQLRWTCVLVSAAEEIASDGIESHDIPGLSAQVQLLCTDYDAAVARARTSQNFDVALEALGPARVLRLLVQSGKTWRVNFVTSAMTMEVDIAEELIVGVRGGAGREIDDSLLGTPALNVLLRETHGTVLARPVARPAVTNVMAPLDTALAAAMHGRKLAPERGSLPSLKASLPTPPDASAPRRLPAPPPSIAGARNGLSRTLIGVPALSSPAPAPRTASLPEVALQGPVAALAPSENDNDQVQSFQRDSLPPAALTSSLAPSSASVSSPQAAGRSSQPSLPPSRTKTIPATDVTQRMAPRVSKPLVGFATAAVVALGLMATFEGSDGGSERAAAAAKVEPSGRSSAKPSALAPKAVPATASKGTAPSAPSSVTPTALEPAVAKGERLLAVPSIAPTQAADPASAMPRENAEPDGPTALAAPAAAGSADERLAALAENHEVREQVGAEEPAVEARAAAAVAVAEPAAEPAAKVSKRRPSAAELRVLDRRATALAKRASSLLRKRQVAPARVLFDEALALAPRNAAALSGRVQVALKERDAELALTHAQTLVGLREKSATAQLLLGDAYRASDEPVKARTAWERAASLGQPLAAARLRTLD